MTLGQLTKHLAMFLVLALCFGAIAVAIDKYYQNRIITLTPPPIVDLGWQRLLGPEKEKAPGEHKIAYSIKETGIVGTIIYRCKLPRIDRDGGRVHLAKIYSKHFQEHNARMIVVCDD